MRYDYFIVGAGFSGSVLAERLANVLGKKVLLIEKRNHIGGNAYDEYDEHGILVHRYGPHIFHTNNKTVVDYLSRFTKWRNYEHKVAAYLAGEYYPVPINMITINKLYNMNLRTATEMRQYFDSVRVKRKPILNSEDAIVNKVGYDLFEKFFKHYTIKQWNHEPKDLSSSVCGRIPIRTNKDCRYFTDKYQFMPIDGYTKMFDKMLANKKIEIVLNTDYKSIVNTIVYNIMIYTGPLDYYFDYQYGKLPYRSIRFEFENIKTADLLKYAQVNYVDNYKPYNRAVEHKYLSGQNKDTTTISREYFSPHGEPYYPVPSLENNKLHKKYSDKMKKLGNVLYCGRLSEYKYYNMDQVVNNALNIFNKIANGS